MNRLKDEGFTLLELLIAILLMGLALAVSYPSLSRGSSAIRLRAAGRDVYNTFRYAREKAVTEQTGMRILVDRQTQKLILSDDLGEGLQTYVMPEGIKIQRIARAGNEVIDGPLAVRFLPNGSSDEAEILLKSASGSYLRIIADPITGGARIESGPGGSAP